MMKKADIWNHKKLFTTLDKWKNSAKKSVINHQAEQNGMRGSVDGRIPTPEMYETL